MGYVFLDSEYWTRTVGWIDEGPGGRDARWLYLWSWTNQHVNGATGIGRVSDGLAIRETGMTRGQYGRAKAWLVERGYVRFFAGDWLWVVRRGQHSLWTGEGPNVKLCQAAAHIIGQPDVPDEVRAAFLERYGGVLGQAKAWPRSTPKGDAKGLLFGSAG